MSRLVTVATVVVGMVGCQLLCRPEAEPRGREECRREGDCRPCDRSEGPERAEASPPAVNRPKAIHVHAPAPEIIIDTPAPVIRQAPAPSVSMALPGPATGTPVYALAGGPQVAAGLPATAAPAVQVLRERVTVGLGSISLPFPRVFRQLEEIPPPAESRPYYPAPALVALPSGYQTSPPAAPPAPVTALLYPQPAPPAALVAMAPAWPVAPQISATMPPAAPPAAPPVAAPQAPAPVPCVTRTEMVCHPVQTTTCGPGVSAGPPPMPPAP
jgi:hypothetical protein